MNKSEIEEERKRLHDLLFERAPDWATHVAKDQTGFSYFYAAPIFIPAWGGWWQLRGFMECQNQPETTLDWKDTLIKRGEYE